ncbi:hypothetical protein [Frankia sp. Cj3]|uniref:hypothetical protein n=1 Tax=Frankia sp. Cj3 TaxID=2880976 RepID=UPI001EF5F23B|nr:hypothetical protein [Frankia sp. Cj3]
MPTGWEDATTSKRPCVVLVAADLDVERRPVSRARPSTALGMRASSWQGGSPVVDVAAVVSVDDGHGLRMSANSSRIVHADQRVWLRAAGA